MEKQNPDVKQFTDIQLMVLIKDFSEEIHRLQGDLKILNDEYLRRCEEFKKSKQASQKVELEDSQEILEPEAL